VNSVNITAPAGFAALESAALEAAAAALRDGAAPKDLISTATQAAIPTSTPNTQGQARLPGEWDAVWLVSGELMQIVVFRAACVHSRIAEAVSEGKSFSLPVNHERFALAYWPPRVN